MNKNTTQTPISDSLGFFLTLSEEFGADPKNREKFEPKERSGLKIGDKVDLKSEFANELYGGFDGKSYQEINEKKITGKVVELAVYNNHYLFGEYAVIEWENGFKCRNIHTSWLSPKING